jgi:NTE family protein
MAGTTSEPSAKRMEVALVLQGGGALGAYEYGAILGLFDAMDKMKERQITLTGVTGVSIGAVNAACVVGADDRDDARKRLSDLWNDFAICAPFFSTDIALLGVPHFYTLWPSLTALYDTDQLLTTLSKHVCFATLNKNATAFVVTAVDVERGTLTWFANRKVGEIKATTITPKHVLASGSLAPQFAWTYVANGSEERPYWDGGIVDNTPLGAAIDSFSPEDEVDRFLVVMNLFPLKAERPNSLTQVNDRVDQLRFGNRLRQDTKNAQVINDMILTIERLKAYAPSKLREEIDEQYGKYKHVITVEVSLSGDAKYSDMDGFRDFSYQGIKSRRDKGREIAFPKIIDAFNTRRAA